MCPVKDLCLKKAKLVAKLAVEKWEKLPSEGGFKATLDAVIDSAKEDAK
jgi:hypothetical protein